MISFSEKHRSELLKKSNPFDTYKYYLNLLTSELPRWVLDEIDYLLHLALLNKLSPEFAALVKQVAEKHNIKGE